MKILVTGGLGYLGGRIALHLGTFYPKEDIRLLARKGGQSVPDWAAGYDVVAGDVLDDSSLKEACAGVDAVIHLAALNEIDSAKDPIKALKVNGEGTYRLLEAAAEKKVGRFVYFSTFHVYGLNAKGRITEETVTAPTHPYAITHRLAEDFVRMSCEKNALKGIILRLSNGFGRPSHVGVNRWSLAFNDFCLQAALTNKIILKSSGKQQRDFVTLTDVSRCAEHILRKDEVFQDNSTIYNLGGENSLSIMDAAKKVSARCGKVLGKKPEIIVENNFGQTQECGPIDYRMDKIKATGYKLTDSMDEEIDETLSFCAKNKSALMRRLKNTLD